MYLTETLRGFKVLTRKPFGDLPRINSLVFTITNVFKPRFSDEGECDCPLKKFFIFLEGDFIYRNW